MPDKIILFDTGDCGVQALNYYGADKIHFFTDNNRGKRGI